VSTAVAVKPLVHASATERRTIAAERFDQLETRVADDGSMEFVGHAAVFDRKSEDLGGFREVIQRGAFRKVLDSNPDIRFLFNHNPDHLLARTTNQTLELREDPKGLRVYAKLAQTSLAKDIDVLVRRQDLTGMSFSFNIGDTGKDIWAEENGEIIRTIIAFGEIGDVGPVTFPAYPATDAGMRSIVQGVEIVDGAGAVVEDSLRDLAWKIHRGELHAASEERAAIDAAFARTNTVAPWIGGARASGCFPRAGAAGRRPREASDSRSRGRALRG
jgi:HK97 family phage prohead protease